MDILGGMEVFYMGNKQEKKEIIKTLVALNAKRLSPRCYRLWKRLDVYPKTRSYHDFYLNKRGVLPDNVEKFLREYIDKNI